VIIKSNTLVQRVGKNGLS